MNLLKFLSDLANEAEEVLISNEVIIYLTKLFTKLVEIFETVYMHENTVRTLFVREEGKPETEEIKKF